MAAGFPAGLKCGFEAVGFQTGLRVFEEFFAEGCFKECLAGLPEGFGLFGFGLFDAGDMALEDSPSGLDEGDFPFDFEDDSFEGKESFLQFVLGGLFENDDFVLGFHQTSGLGRLRIGASFIQRFSGMFTDSEPSEIRKVFPGLMGLVVIRSTSGLSVVERIFSRVWSRHRFFSVIWRRLGRRIVMVMPPPMMILGSGSRMRSPSIMMQVRPTTRQAALVKTRVLSFGVSMIL